MEGLSTSQQMNLKAPMWTHPEVFKLTDSESCENLQLKAVLHAHTRSAAATQMWTDGWAAMPPATKQRQGQNLLAPN